MQCPNCFNYIEGVKSIQNVTRLWDIGSPLPIKLDSITRYYADPCGCWMTQKEFESFKLPVKCSRCGNTFKADEEFIQTAHINSCGLEEYVTLCRTCYDKAGNDVR